MPGLKAPEEARREQILQAAFRVANRAGVEGVTVRAVAEEAGLSHGSVLFHFGRKDRLVAALLDLVLSTTALLDLSGTIGRDGPAPERVRAHLRDGVQQLRQRPDEMRLFFEYWSRGARDAGIRTRIGAALRRYREAFHALAEDALASSPNSRPDVTPAGLAAVAVSLVSGCAVQWLADRETFDMPAYLDTVSGILDQVLEPSGTQA